MCIQTPMTRMLPAKSAEESKADRLKRQQARFRDRGGAFVPSTSNPLVDILLARTVTGESPSKAARKDAAAKRPSPSKARHASPTPKAGAVTKRQAVAGSSKSKLPASRKGGAKAVETKADPPIKPAPKRRGKPAQGKKKAPDPESDTEQPPPPTTKSKITSRGKGKQRVAPSTSDGKPKPKARTKSNPAKQVVEVLVSDDDQTLVEVPRKVKFDPKRNIQYEDDGETDDDVPIVRKRAMPHVADSKASGTKSVTRVETERAVGTGSSGKKSLEDGEEKTQDEKYTKTNAKKRLVSRGDDKDDDVAAPPAKKGKVVNSMSAKPNTAIEPEPEPASRPTKDIKNGEFPKAAGKRKRKGITEPTQDIVEAVEKDDDERPLERVPKPKKRKKEEDNYDNRPRKTLRFSEPGPPHSTSQKLKENQSGSKHERAAKSGAKDEPDAPPRPKLATKTPKGPPRKVLERIKASAARHLRCVDSEPDELDCLS